MSKISNKIWGFTLVEVAVAGALLGIISLAVVSLFTTGIKVYYKLRDYTCVYVDALITLDKLERDLKNTRDISEISFQGEPKKIAFPIVLDNPEAEAKPGDAICSLTYYYDDYKKALMKSTEGYTRVIAGLGPRDEDIETLMAVTGVKFQYYYYNEEAQVYEWKESWFYSSKSSEDEEKKEEEMSAPPIAVKVELSYQARGKDAVLSRFVFLPLSAYARLAEMKKEARDRKESEEGDDEAGSAE